MSYFLISIFFLLFNFTIFSQVGMDQWRLHVSPNVAIDLVEGNGTIYVILEKGLFDYDIETGEKTLWTVTDYLSDVSPSAIGYHDDSKSVLIGYQNGNLDLLKNETIYNLPFILQSSVSGVKRINKIVTHGQYAYIATGVGIVVLDIAKREVRDTYHPTNEPVEFLDIAFNQGKIYAITNKDVYVGNLSNSFLADPSLWTKLPNIPDYSDFGGYKIIETFKEDVFLGFINEGFWEGDTLYKLVNNELEIFNGGMNLNSINGKGSHFVVSSTSAVTIYNENLESEGALYLYPNDEEVAPLNCFFIDGAYFLIDDRLGLVKSHGNYSRQVIGFEGARYNTAYRLDWNMDKLSVACGGFKGTTPQFSLDGGAYFENQEWKSLPIRNNPEYYDLTIWDFVCTAVNPLNPEEIAYGTISPTPVIITKEGKLDRYYDLENSILEEQASNGWAFVSDLTYDEKGNLWIANAFADKSLKVLTKDGDWLEFDTGTSIKGRETKRIVIDHNDVKWVTTKTAGLIAFDSGSKMEDAGDDRYKHFTTGDNQGALPSNDVEAIAVDIDNNIWIGTPEGMRVLYNSSGIFDAAPGQYNFQKLLIQFGENVEIVLGTTHITSIRVDGGNRKWIGTANSGVFLLSPDGLEIEKHFTKENSPLISNTIYDIAIDHTTGEVFFATPEGLISYRSDASQGDIKYSNVIVFPNPVKPDYFGPITIQGIAYDSDVKITDISGKLVYQTKSNGGTATWSGNTIDGDRASTGVYLIWTSIDDHEFKGRKVGKVVLIN